VNAADMRLQSWKWPQIAKGALTWVPPLNTWRKRRLSTGGTDNPRYCYAVWLRHLVTLNRWGFDVRSARVAELGPGESTGTGFAALLSGAASYTGLDVVAFFPRNAEEIFETLVKLFREKAPIPNDDEFPRVKPRIESYEFPDHLIEWPGFNDRVQQLRAEIKAGLHSGPMMSYHAPWTSVEDILPGSLDLVFSQAVLEYVPIHKAYGAMSTWLKSESYASHVIDLSAHYLSPYSNGHWAYSDWQWYLANGKREASLNREPLSTHVTCANTNGFEVIWLHKDRTTKGLRSDELSARYRSMDTGDLETRGATIILKKRREQEVLSRGLK
jgi:hypothetical protein